MTLQPYTPDRLDELALRVLDLAGGLRALARQSRAESLTEFTLHDKKALEWLARLEEWAHKAEADVALALMRQRGSRRAAAVIAAAADPAPSVGGSQEDRAVGAD